MQPADPCGHDRVPVELAFLCRHGVDGEALAAAARWARHWQVSVAEAVLALDLLPEDAFYRALADELGIPFLPATVPIGNGAAFPDALTAQVLPLAPNDQGLRIAVAPRGRAIDLVRRHRALFVRAGAALTSPGRLEALAHERFRSQNADEAAGRLSRHRPAFSARDGLTRGQAAALGGLLAGGFAGMLLAPVRLLEISMFASGVVFLAMAMLRIYCVLFHRGRNSTPLARPLTDAELPVYTVIVPLYQEARVASQLVHALRALDYPPPKLDIRLVLEADDRLTRAAIEACRLPGHCRILTVPAGEPRTKPRALNAALASARGSHVVIYDAEDIPDPQQLRIAAALFRAFPDVACLQGRLVIDNPADSFIASLFAVEYAALFDAVNPGLLRAGLPLLLGGTSNHLRTRVLRDIGGWDAWNVTEDADLGIRLARFGHRTMDLPSATREEAPFSWRAWMGQRTRWMKGWMQTFITHSRAPAHAWRELGPMGFIAVATLTLGTVLGAMGMPLFVAVTVGMLIDSYGTSPDWPRVAALGFSLTVMLCGALAFLAPVVTGLAYRRRLALLRFLPLAPLYLLMLTIAAWSGLRSLLVEPWYWHKTGHGLSRRRWPVRFTDSR